MHITTKDIVAKQEDLLKYPDASLPIGTHILTSIIEGDGPVALCSELAKFDAKVISTQRTASGGIQVQTAVSVAEPGLVSTASGPNADALRFLQSKGFSGDESAAHLDKFGATRILAQCDKDAAAENAKLDEEVGSAIGGRPTVDPATITVQTPSERAVTYGLNPHGNETLANWDQARATQNVPLVPLQTPYVQTPAERAAAPAPTTGTDPVTGRPNAAIAAERAGVAAPVFDASGNSTRLTHPAHVGPERRNPSTVPYVGVERRKA